MATFAYSKWGQESFGTPGGVVTWSVIGPGLEGVSDTFGTGRSNLTKDGDALTSFNSERLIRSAFEEWSRFANLEFVQVLDDAATVGAHSAADIRIAYGEIDGDDGRTLAYAFYPSNGAEGGDILIDFDERDFYSDREAFRTTVLHEIGHSIGLGHSASKLAIMAPHSWVSTGLHGDDISGARRIYGAQDGERAPLRMAEDQTEITVRGYYDDLEIIGTGNADLIKGGSGDERLSGEAGGDRLFGRYGADTVAGGGGDDVIFGGRHGDVLLGGVGDDRIHGEADDDMLRGQSGADRLWGGAGDDRLKGGHGDDWLDGGDNADRLLGEAGADTLRGGAGDDLLIGGRHDDWLAGGTGDDQLRGGQGADTLFGRNGDDLLVGAAGDDVLGGGGGNDTLLGGSGADVLSGFGGSDALTGGAGADVFVFQRRTDDDTVTDFEIGVDLLDFSSHDGVGSLDDLSIRASGADTEIHDAFGGRVILRGVDADDLGDDDFIF